MWSYNYVYIYIYIYIYIYVCIYILWFVYLYHGPIWLITQTGKCGLHLDGAPDVLTLNISHWDTYRTHVPSGKAILDSLSKYFHYRGRLDTTVWLKMLQDNVVRIQSRAVSLYISYVPVGVFLCGMFSFHKESHFSRTASVLVLCGYYSNATSWLLWYYVNWLHTHHVCGIWRMAWHHEHCLYAYRVHVILWVAWFYVSCGNVVLCSLCTHICRW